MGRQEFEKQFKDKLEKRELNPSGVSWDLLAARLDSEKKKPNPLFWWIGIAAGIMGGILIYSLVFTFRPNIETPIIVDFPSEKTIEKVPVTPINNSNVQVVTEEVAPGNISEEQVNASENRINSKHNNAALNTKTLPVVVSTGKVSEQEQEEFQISNVETPEDTRMNSKLAEIIAAVSSEASEQDATDAEINALLYKAAGEISLLERRDYLAGTINADDLLFEVEMELEQTFREKVFDLLKDGYTKARSAVANRN